MNCPSCLKEIDHVITVSEFTQKQRVKGDVFLEEYEDVNDAISDSKYKLCPNCLSEIEGKSYSFLEAQVDRLLKAQGGWGMVSELDSLEEARVLVQGLYDRVDAYEKPMPCGHKGRYAVNSEEGTGYCVMCAIEAINLIIKAHNGNFDEINRLALLPEDGGNPKNEPDDPMTLLMKIALLSGKYNRSSLRYKNETD